MRLLRCLIMIFATLAMAAIPASASAARTHAMQAVGIDHHAHRTASGTDSVATRCAGHHHHKEHQDGRCCGMACCGPTCIPTASSGAVGSRRDPRTVSATRPTGVANVDAAPFSLPDRPPIDG